MPSIYITIRDGMAQEVCVEGLDLGDLDIEVRDYDAVGRPNEDEQLCVDEHGEFLLTRAWVESASSGERKPRIREAADADFESDQAARAERFKSL